MKVTRKTNLRMLIVLFILCQVDFNAARPNTVKGARRNSVNKMNKGKRNWTPAASPMDEAKEPRVGTRAVDDATPEASGDVKKDRNDGVVSSRMWLELEGIPPPQISMKRHEGVTLECTAVGSPPPMIYWLKNGKPVDNSVSFEFESTNRIDRRGPSASDKLANFAMAKLKSKLPIRCLAEDEAEYSCVADNEGRQLVATTMVTIDDDDSTTIARPECDFKHSVYFYNKKGKRGQPAYIMSSESLHMEAIGSDIILPCRGSGRPRPVISWIDADGHRIVNGKKFQINTNGDLAIRNLSWNEMGEYTCIVENNFGNDSSATFLYPLLTEDS